MAANPNAANPNAANPHFIPNLNIQIQTQMQTLGHVVIAHLNGLTTALVNSFPEPVPILIANHAFQDEFLDGPGAHVSYGHGILEIVAARYGAGVYWGRIRHTLIELMEEAPPAVLGIPQAIQPADAANLKILFVAMAIGMMAASAVVYVDDDNIDAVKGVLHADMLNPQGTLGAFNIAHHLEATPNFPLPAQHPLRIFSLEHYRLVAGQVTVNPDGVELAEGYSVIMIRFLCGFQVGHCQQVHDLLEDLVPGVLQGFKIAAYSLCGNHYGNGRFNLMR